jgi:hypothetical protein
MRGTSAMGHKRKPAGKGVRALESASGHQPPITLKVADFRFALEAGVYEYIP